MVISTVETWGAVVAATRFIEAQMVASFGPNIHYQPKNLELRTLGTSKRPKSRWTMTTTPRLLVSEHREQEHARSSAQSALKMQTATRPQPARSVCQERSQAEAYSLQTVLHNARRALQGAPHHKARSCPTVHRAQPVRQIPMRMLGHRAKRALQERLQQTT